MSVPITTQATFAATLVDEWVRSGVTSAVICPGSRSTPLALALADRTEISVHVRLDERGAGFFALGLALDRGAPVVICVTSGTAAAELHASVIEADLSRVPLLVCTADRPPELHHVGAPQTIDQSHLYGSSVRWFAEPGVADEGGRATWRSLAARSVAEAVAGPMGPGPVHLNLAFRDPLTGTPGPLPEGPSDGVSVHRVVASDDVDRDAVQRWIATNAGRRGVIVAGGGAGSPDKVSALSALLGWPVLADPRSGSRRTDTAAVGAADALLRHEALAEALRPEVILMLGSSWVSKVVNAFVATAAVQGADVVAVDPWWRWIDPDRVVTTTFRTESDRWLEAALIEGHVATPEGWCDRWQTAESIAQHTIDLALSSDVVMTEPAVARQLLSTLPPETRVVVSASMPIRDLEWFTPALAAPPSVYSNRGANGIDGVVSTALGLSAADPERRVVAVVGDLAFLHDSSALVTSIGQELACTIVVLDNGGGGIFSFLPQAGALATDRYEQLFGTPQRVDIGAVAAGFGHRVHEVNDLNELTDQLTQVSSGGIEVVWVRLPDRTANVAVHDRISQSVYAALDAAIVL